MAVTPGGAEPRFPGFDVTDEAGAWDRETAAVVFARLGPRAPLVFFSATEEPTARALVGRVLAQDEEPRVPVLEMIDERLANRLGDGFRYEDLPEDPEAWRASLAALDAEARERHRRPFAEIAHGEQMAIVEGIRELEGTWRGLPAKRVFSLWMRYCCDAFYAHPWAWNEIGFPGPAYPRGYANLGFNRREHWEVAEHDERDPVPWAERTEAARRRHSAALPKLPPDPVPDPSTRNSHDAPAVEERSAR